MYPHSQGDHTNLRNHEVQTHNSQSISIVYARSVTKLIMWPGVTKFMYWLWYIKLNVFALVQ